MTPMIELKQLRAGYHGEEILHGLDLTLPQGGITAIVGPNGCGKTTLLKTLCGLLPPMSGELRLKGRELSEYKGRELARLAAVLPQVRDVPAITVGQFVAHGRYPHLSFGRNLTAKDRERIEWALTETATAHLQEKELSTLSGGERQRVYLAMTLCQDTELLFLDEPTTYLDIDQKYETMEMVRRINRLGKTVVMVLHDLPFAFSYSDRILVMEQGRIYSEGPTETQAEAAAAVFGVKVQKIALEKGREYVFYR